MTDLRKLTDAELEREIERRAYMLADARTAYVIAVAREHFADATAEQRRRRALTNPI